jgi:hypothetical protein
MPLIAARWQRGVRPRVTHTTPPADEPKSSSRDDDPRGLVGAPPQPVGTSPEPGGFLR